MYPVSHPSARLLLRELEAGDVDAVLGIYGSAEATRHLSFEPRSREQVEQIVGRSIGSARARPRTEYALAVCVRQGGELVGFARLADDPHQQRAVTMGFALRPDAWGRGYGTETVAALLAFSFGPLGLHRVWAARSPLNTASEKILLRAGMTEEGRIRQHVHVRGAWRDSLVHAITEDEWNNRPAGTGASG
ncbi:GNAT family protein [Streptomyces sp. DSM 44917]|uniref:GNAT family protein n=1 Tax=Streptomyces boetiae TaxID=3075541 RepID=A0ABU2L2T8_9ACTN|nr:GNAT family protein [Streptomyces sp. DSM 44917]MDT0305869.1 GNAT family protein [Streptomyces sp. DSM 44917]